MEQEGMAILLSTKLRTRTLTEVPLLRTLGIVELLESHLLRLGAGAQELSMNSSGTQTKSTIY